MAEPPLLSIEPNAGDYDYVDPDKDRQRGAEESLRRERLREVESAIHHRFRHARVRGEWFRPVPELLSYIDEVKTG